MILPLLPDKKRHAAAFIVGPRAQSVQESGSFIARHFQCALVADQIGVLERRNS